MDPRKLFLIIKREYMTRIRSRVFIISTILAPIIILAIIFVPILMTKYDNGQTYQVAIVDHTGQVAQRLVQMNGARYLAMDNTSVDSLKKMVIKGSITGYIVITQDILDGKTNPELVSSGTGGISLMIDVQSNLQTAIRDALLSRVNLNSEIKQIIDRHIDLKTSKLTEGGQQAQNTTILFIIGYIMAFAIYTAMFTYGGIIMRGVLEEKTSRIIEIMASSAKPIELLIGKVIGVGLVGATQFAIWALLISSAATFGAPFIMQLIGSGSPAHAASAASSFSIPSIPPSLWIYFILFFILGYLMYGALFAAVGSAADSETDIQQLMFPIILPIIIPILLLGAVASNPDSTMAIVTSMIPLFSPILMIARLAITDVPLWQSLGSIALMLLTFWLFMWLSSRIYRVGILMYGKKPSLKELARWVRYR